MSSRSRLLAAASALAALAYPAVLWCGVRISPVFVALSVAVPLVGLFAAARLDGRARVIAHLVVAAPPLFSLLGGWLDFQHAVPIGSIDVWIPMWAALAIAAARTQPHDSVPARSAGRRLAIAHGVSAALIGLFALAHVTNHVAGLFGGDVHIAIMNALRRVYRHSIVEPVLLAAVAFQIGSGAWLLGRKLARSGDVLQTASGAYLLAFLLSHVSAALRARFHGRDPNWHWLAGGELLRDPWSVRLVPYYFLAVVALGLHASCGLETVLRGHGIAVNSRAPTIALTTIAAAISGLILVGLFRA